jgi:hypothetical protein
MHISRQPPDPPCCGAIDTGSMQIAKKRRLAVAGTALGLVAAGCYIVARRWFSSWGATKSERTEHLPGDDLIQHPSVNTTRAVTIHAPPEQVWPWIVQMGQDRAGLYSYDWLENLCGLQFRNADHIVADWHHLDIGDQIRAAPPKAGPEGGFTVVALEPQQLILTAIGDPAVVLPQTRDGHLPEGGTWAFVLRPTPRGTRLIVRLRALRPQPNSRTSRRQTARARPLRHGEKAASRDPAARRKTDPTRARHRCCGGHTVDPTADGRLNRRVPPARTTGRVLDRLIGSAVKARWGLVNVEWATALTRTGRGQWQDVFVGGERCSHRAAIGGAARMSLVDGCVPGMT